MKTQATPLPKHLEIYVGNLYDTRQNPPERIRNNYAWQFGRIDKLSEVKATLRSGPFVWPGGYPLHFVTQDGAALCFACVRKEWRQVVWDFLRNGSTGWRITGAQVNWEDNELTCDHCSKPIESAYGND